MPCTPVPTSPAHNPGPAPRRRVRRSRLPPRAVLAPPRGAAHPYPGFPRAASQGGASGLILESQSQASPTRPARYPGGAMEPRVVADAVETGEEDVIMEALRTYNRENSQSFTFDDAQQEDRKRLAELLVAVLERGLPPSRRVTWLQSIRILTRDRSCLEPFTSRQSLQALASYAGIALEGSVPEPLDMDVVLESLKCLCNLVLSSPVAQVLAAEARLVVRLAERVGLYHKSSFPHEVQFFDLRLLFLLTALRTDARQQLFQELQGVRLLTAALELTLGMTPDGGPPELLPPQETERAMEILKVLFNITFDSIKREVDEMLPFIGTWGLFCGTV
ncbi:synembryn-a isoform 2 [Lynx pardinus]|uniref:Synembryn n=1 Tax=Lynx pardinus TaxID=191816 RepID=A0A485PR15_LYNPA|nr:synembryn-a isoform 2 [Lynx pardinus]